MTDPKNTLPPNTSKPSETAQASLTESESNQPITQNQTPTADNPPASSLNIEPSAESKEPSAQSKEPSAQSKEPSAQTKEPSAQTKETSVAPGKTTQQLSDGDQQLSAVDKQRSRDNSQPENKMEQTTLKSKTPSARSGNPPPPQKNSGLARVSLFISVITLILLAASCLYFWQNQIQQTTQIEQLHEQSSTLMRKYEADQASAHQNLSKLDDRLFVQQDAISQLRQQAAFNAQKLTDLGARSRMDWLLAEAEYLMRLANQRLNLEHDVQSAEAMLSSADSILAEINDPGLTEIRKTLANEVLSLQQVRHLDRQGLYFKLDALVLKIDELKQQAFISEEPTSQASTTSASANASASTTASENTFLEIWQSIWKDLKQAVTIRRLDQPLPPLLAPEQHYYLKQNLRLMLEQAGLALLHEDSAVFQSSLRKADNWLKQYFLQNDPLVQQIQVTLNEMASYEISLKLPDISHSLRLTKAKIESFYREHSLNKLSSPESDLKAELSQDSATQQRPSAQGAAL